MSLEERDTIPAPPVPSINPHDVERKRNRYAIFGRRDSTYCGIEVLDGIAKRITPLTTEDVAHEWLHRAQLSAVHGTMFPEFCERGHLKETVGLCGQCLSGGGR